MNRSSYSNSMIKPPIKGIPNRAAWFFAAPRFRC